MHEISDTENLSEHLCFSGSRSSSSEEEISPPLEPGKGFIGTLRGELKQVSPDFELEWSEGIELSGLPETNEIFSIMEDISPIQHFQNIFQRGMKSTCTQHK
jgi:hypothetical protein